jgi:hypothetical protein
MRFVNFVRNRACNCEIEFMCRDYSFVILCCESNQTHAREMNMSICESICEVLIVFVLGK